MGERMKVLLIVNPAAGQLKAKTGLMDIVRRMNALGCLVTVVTTQRRSQASELVRELAADYDRLVCCGGGETPCGHRCLKRHGKLSSPFSTGNSRRGNRGGEVTGGSFSRRYSQDHGCRSGGDRGYRRFRRDRRP